LKDIGKIIEEIDKHKERLEYTINKIKSWESIEEKTLNNPDKVEVLDSLIFRFAKMQDSIGQKLFAAILRQIGEEDRNIPFIDILNRLEQLEFIESASIWKKIREARNILTHTYPWETELIIEGIKETIVLSEKLMSIYEKIKIKLQKYV
jgi:hypothetical protein